MRFPCNMVITQHPGTQARKQVFRQFCIFLFFLFINFSERERLCVAEEKGERKNLKQALY